MLDRLVDSAMLNWLVDSAMLNRLVDITILDRLAVRCWIGLLILRRLGRLTVS